MFCSLVYLIVYGVMCALKTGKVRSGLDDVVFRVGIAGPFTNEVGFEAGGPAILDDNGGKDEPFDVCISPVLRKRHRVLKGRHYL